MFAEFGARVKVPPVAVKAFQETPPSERKDGLFDPAAKSALEAEIAPVPAFKITPDVAKVAIAPPAELLSIERFSFPEESESDVMLADKLWSRFR